ncbi:hypothetical protein GF324_11460, partial [bacterium]|nr:hypothetical protein [bacterium]
MKRTALTTALAIALLAAAGMPAQAHDKEGFIYGKVTTRSGNEYTGLIRWGEEETFWDDLFHSSKEDNPFMDYAGKAGQRYLMKSEVKELEVELDRLRKKQEELREEMGRARNEQDREVYEIQTEAIETTIDALRETIEDIRDEVEEREDNN